ncbi:hypothetical protein B0H14DRAFT_2607636 [Mycena olivaceomarginata]|nr:hypothetical protein B0H14DRAFT_2607636 [Mycena olivaceomarginata]
MAAPKPAPKPRKPLSYEDTLNRQFMGSIYSGRYYRKNREQRNAQTRERMARLRAKDHTVPPEVLQARLDARQEAARKYREKCSSSPLRLSFAEWRKCTRWRTAARRPPRNRLPSATTMTDVTTPDARKPDKPRDLSEALAELAAEKPQPICQRHDEATRKAVAAAARKPVDYSLLPPRRRPIRLLSLYRNVNLKQQAQTWDSGDPEESLEMATHSDNANKTDGLPALTEAEDDNNEIPELIPVIEHDSGTYIPSARCGPDCRKPANLQTGEAYVDMAALAKHAHILFVMDAAPAPSYILGEIVKRWRGATASTAADLPTESGATLSQKAPTAHIPRTRQLAAMPSLIRAELPPPSLQPTRGFTQRRLSLTADEYAQSWILEDAIKLPQAIFDEATGALGTDAFVAAATGVEELWLSQWDADASWGGGSTWDTPPAVDVGWGRSAPGFGGWGWSSFRLCCISFT